MTLTQRGLTPADIPAWNRLLAAAEAVDRMAEHYNEDDLAEEMANPDIEPDLDIVGAFDGQELVGYWATYPRVAADTMKVHLSGTVAPHRRGQGIGTVLVDAMLVRARQLHCDQAPQLPAMLALSAPAEDTVRQDLFCGFGLVPQRWSFTMRVDLADVPEPVPVPGGLEVRPFDDGYGAPMLAAHNEAFRDHPNFTPWTDVQWRQWVLESRNFRPDLSFVVVEPDAPRRVLAYVQSYEFDAHFEATGRREGYVGKVGTLREHRGRGVARALLGHTLVAYRQAGLDEASLDVDSENPTGALGVYRSVGFEVERRNTDYVLTIPPA